MTTLENQIITSAVSRDDPPVGVKNLGKSQAVPIKPRNAPAW